jgi:hypothetical protein
MIRTYGRPHLDQKAGAANLATATSGPSTEHRSESGGVS